MQSYSNANRTESAALSTSGTTPKHVGTELNAPLTWLVPSRIKAGRFGKNVIRFPAAFVAVPRFDITLHVASLLLILSSAHCTASLQAV